MKKLLYLSMILLMSSTDGLSLTYTTINDGNWNNNSTVWSTNGLTPCGCSPNYNLANDTVVIRNYIDLTGSLTLNGSTLLWIPAGGSLVNSVMKLELKNGKVISSGLLSINEMKIGSNAEAHFTSAVLNVQNKMEVSGIFNAHFSNVYIQNGNIDILSSGSFSVTGNSKIYFNIGNFNNYGNTIIDGESCIQLGSGNFRNYSDGTFDGTGSVISDNGNIMNQGTWSNSLNWCVSGVATGVSSTENCTTANDMCNFAPLAAELVNFNIVAGESSNIINWYTYAEEPGDWYILQRSADSRTWEQIGHKTSVGEGGQLTHYILIDERPLQTLSYYKLIQFNADGSEGFSAILAVNPVFKQEVVVFPNPTSDRITIRFTRTEANVSVRITDSAGNTLDRYTIENSKEESFLIPYPCGMYFIYLEGENLYETIKVIKR